MGCKDKKGAEAAQLLFEAAKKRLPDAILTPKTNSFIAACQQSPIECLASGAVEGNAEETEEETQEETEEETVEGSQTTAAKQAVKKAKKAGKKKVAPKKR